MKSHILVGMALVLAVLALVSVHPGVADARDGRVETQSQVLALALGGSDGGGTSDAPGDEPGVENLNGDPEDWLGGQNIRPIPPKPGSSDDPPINIFDEFENLWKSLIRSLEELAR